MTDCVMTLCKEKGSQAWWFGALYLDPLSQLGNSSLAFRVLVSMVPLHSCTRRQSLAHRHPVDFVYVYVPCSTRVGS
ncbi:hypothetical protein DPEC_G00288690 [Dallia pectoralis]|uniref:Uncharacterized protein n=1 Tax=Dallia pectoralis TaxID=75939 RepID=A0ACC2FKN5_DALPE|nr:hypothetical protein DPEC_G00288690 [Dallia pectoralis]